LNSCFACADADGLKTEKNAITKSKRKDHLKLLLLIFIPNEEFLEIKNMVSTYR
jgi:hypothetical protein